MRPALLLLIPLLLAAAPAAPAADAFARSEAGRRLSELGVSVLDARAVSPDELLVATYVPEQGELNEWDDETRLTLYRRASAGAYEWKQFLSKSGKSPKGRMAGWVFHDMDGDGLDELIIVGREALPFRRVDVQLYRRPAAEAPYGLVWARQERLAAFRLEPDGRLLFTYEARGRESRRVFERHRLVEGTLKEE